MAALVPLNDARNLSPLRDAGVQEIYVGFHDDAWDARFGEQAELNRMSGFGLEANPFDFEQMLGHIRTATQMGFRTFVCFNSATYTHEQLGFIANEYLEDIAQTGATGVILSSCGLIAQARQAGLDAVISTVAGVFNEQLAAYYRDRGATRVILPRDLSVEEISQVVGAVPDLQYEVFLMRNGCMFSDSHCLGCHKAGVPSLCRSLREGDVFVREVNAASRGDATPSGRVVRAWDNERLMNERYHRRTCGLCALWRFERLGISAYKVVGRGDDAEDLCFDAGLVVRNAQLARSCATEEGYFQKMERPRQPETLCGYQGLSCYYPEIARCNLAD